MKQRGRSARKGSAAHKPSFTLPRSAERAVRYWLASIADGERMELSGAAIRHSAVEASYADISNALCSPEVVEALQRKAREHRDRKSRTKREGETQFAGAEEKLDVLICPCRLKREGAPDPLLGPQPPFIEPIWIPARLEAEGELRPPTHSLPWIPRSLLEPMTGDQTVTIGSVDDFERHLDRYPFSEPSDWSSYLRSCARLFKAVTGENISEFTIPGYRRRRNGVLLVDSTSGGASRHTRRTFEQLLRGSRPAGLLPKVTRSKKKPPIYTKETAGTYAAGARRHLGQFGYAFPLSPSQRNAVHRFIEVGDNEILTVNGPPGTGKTTLLQSIIATLWVDAAARGLKPPIITACAGTNQAVTNIIVTFGKASTRPGPLAGRWLPGVHSFATYCPSGMRAEEDNLEGIHIERTTGEGLSRTMEEWQYLQKARREYLERCAAFLGRKTGLRPAVRALQSALRRELSLLRSDISFALHGTPVEWLQSALGLKPPKKHSELIAAAAKLDCTRRHRAFQLAVHYWEGRWLSAAADEAARVESEGGRPGRLKDGAEHWRRRAMVTPCFVSTASMAPQFFGALNEEGEPLIDLLIVDEAGQIQPETGAALLALGRRALAVGDTQQLEPVFNIPPHIDQQNLISAKLMKQGDRRQLADLRKRGITASSGNMMLLSQGACPIVDKQRTIGVFLSDHRRSVPELVAFCNALAYQDRLIPRRPPRPGRIIPAFGWAHIGGRSERAGTSRQNSAEAKAIAAWLLRKRSHIEEHYEGRPLEDIVAVITPFAAQRRVLERLIHPELSGMVIGTVHALQGAERDIIVFSAVYDSTDRPESFFFDRGVQMLNVAVSRAKDSFLVFADMNIFDPTRQAPSGLLARFLLEHPENELDDIEVPLRKSFTGEQMQRLSSLEQHRRALRYALESAKEELLIVSPQISSAALEADSLAQQIAEARSRGVRVTIFTDARLDVDSQTGALRPNAEHGRAMLQQAGARLLLADGIHNKTLAIDDRELIEGSFNWLSAVRSAKRAHHREETSWHYRGAKAAAEIEKTKEFLTHRLIEEPRE